MKMIEGYEGCVEESVEIIYEGENFRQRTYKVKGLAYVHDYHTRLRRALDQQNWKN